jgi:predicted nucleotidyltransferase
MESTGEFSPPTQEMFKTITTSIRKNSIATPESKTKREDFEKKVPRLTQEVKSIFKDKEIKLGIGLIGSVQTGLANPESDTDAVLFFEPDDPQLIDIPSKEISSLENGLIVLAYNIRDVHELVTNGAKFSSASLDEAYKSENDIVNSYKNKEDVDFLIEGSGNWDKLRPLTTLFNYTSPDQEMAGSQIMLWRKDILEKISKRPDAGVFWDMVRIAWMDKNVWVENDTSEFKDRSTAVKTLIDKTIADRLGTGQTVDKTSDEYAKQYEIIERTRKSNLLPSLPRMLKEFGVENIK